MNNDRVTELYQGEFSSKENQRICRDRIDWMVGRIAGERVLDIGCSQGIASILAARAGKRVVGVDNEEPAIEYARRALLAEPPAMHDRVRFVLADILESDLDGARFDTVLLGEILEHHADPRRLFERAIRFLADDGLLVVTTPFGYHPHDDHRTTFYLSNFASTIDGLCAPADLTLVDGYIRFIGRALGASLADPLDLTPAAQLARSEEGFLGKEERYQELVGERTRQVRRTQAEVERQQLRAQALLEQVTELRTVIDRQRSKNVDLSAQKSKLKEDIRGLRSELRQARRAARLPEILPPPPDAGKFRRSLAMVFGSMQHEIHLGRAFRRPHTSLLKTFYRTRKALSAPPQAPREAAPQEVPKEKPAPAAPRQAAPVFEPYQAGVSARPAPLTIATILDTFSESCFRYEANLVPLSVKSWREEMEAHRPAFLLCESAWVGNGGQWQYTMSKYATRENNPLRELLTWCKQQRIPRVFWNKEDPSNFDVFKDVAAEFDHVFTTDADCIPRYRQILDHDRVYALPFAAQPAIHNPIQDRIKRSGSVCFAGSWRARKYPERATDSEVLLGPALELGLEIFDRNAGSKHAAELAFPPPYAAAVRGALDYDAMLTAYRSYKVFLNVNSVKSSPTMFARRVFELMACGTPVVSSDSAGIRTMLGTLVKIATTPEETRGHLERLLADSDYRGRFAHAGYREVLQRHTYRERLHEILARLGIEAAPPTAPLVTILAGTNRPERIANLLGSIRRQVHPNLEAILLLNADAYDQRAVEEAAADLPRLKVFKLPESYTLAECLNHGLEHASGAWVAKFDDDDYYGPHYLSDLLLATGYTDARVLGKRSCFCWLEGSGQLVHRFPESAHRHVEYVLGATMFIRRDVFDQVQFSPVVRGTDTVFQRHCRERGIDIYGADPYNYIVVRKADTASHTWQISDEDVLAKSREVASRLDMGMVMI